MYRAIVLSLFFCTFFQMGRLYSYPSCIDLGGGYTYLNRSPFSGNLYEFQGAYSYQIANQVYGGVTFKLQKGSIHSTQREKCIFDIDTQERLGYSFGTKDSKWLLSLFTGLGYRYLNVEESWHHISFSSTHNDLYVPLGLFVDGAIGSFFHLGFHGQWRPQVYPTMSISSKANTQYLTERKLRNFLIEMPLALRLTSSDRVYLTLKPFFDFWQEGKRYQVTKSTATIPEQTFIFVGINASISTYF